MLKTALFDCAINEKCCSVGGGRGICPLFSSPLRGIWQLKSPQPGNLLSKAKKMLMLGGQPGGVGEGRDKMFVCVGLVNRPDFPKRSLVLKSFTIHSLCQAFGQCRWAKKANEKRKKRSKKNGGFSPHSLRGFFALFLFGSVFTIFLGAWNRLHNTNQRSHSCNAGTLSFNAGRLCHGRKFRKWVWFARFWDPKVSYCYTNAFLFHFGGSFLILWANWILLNLRFVS